MAGLLIALLLIRPKGALLSEAVRLLPDLVRLLRRLAADKTLPRGVRVRLGLLTVDLALPIDLVPDFLPVIGYADDAIIVAFVLRSVVRLAGIEAVQAHWTGTDDGFAALACLTGLHRAAPRPRLVRRTVRGAHPETHPKGRSPLSYMRERTPNGPTTPAFSMLRHSTD
ncbi:YkvA family protein [Streptomyces chattanoogensis]|uniref:YkvA family protein n=1 Tax=Streptomyces chattanoogensis TaxID=66876 RepID=UPI000A72F780|nr:DUF1232 domain-containing protein [Streptomyces chattanoogensis]